VVLQRRTSADLVASGLIAGRKSKRITVLPEQGRAVIGTAISIDGSEPSIEHAEGQKPRTPGRPRSPSRGRPGPTPAHTCGSPPPTLLAVAGGNTPGQRFGAGAYDDAVDAPSHAVPGRSSTAGSTHGTYLGRTREERAADRRERLMRAAFGLFATRSYEDVTVADVCAEARVAKRYFYEHFADRRALLTAVHQQRNNWLLAGIVAAVPEQPATLEALLGPMMTALTTMLASDPPSARVIYINAPRMELRRRDVIRDDARRLSAFVTTTLGRHPRDPVRHHRAAVAVAAGISEVIIEWLDEGMPDDALTLADHLTGLATALLAPTL
jgi:AcrR family transcriptional regulator